MVKKTVATHRLKEMNHHLPLEKLAAWKKTCGFDRCDVHDREWQPWSHGHVCSGDAPEHSQIDVDSDSRRPPTP